MGRGVAHGVFLLVLIIGGGCGQPEPGISLVFSTYPRLETDPLRPHSVLVKTSLGRIKFKLFPNEAPLAVNSFMFLARQGFFEGMTAYRLLPGVLAETGDPTGTGGGGPG